MPRFGYFKRMIKAVLIDLSGTLHIDDEAIPGAVEALKKLRATNVKIKFVTNTTKDSQNDLHQRLKKLGFDIKKEEIFSSLIAARQLIIKNKLKPLYLLSKSAQEDFKELQFEDKINAVVIGLAPEEFNYEKLNIAFRHLLDGAKLIAIHEGRYYKRKDGLALGPGCFVKGLEYSANVKAEIVGKPNQTFFISAIQDICEPKECVMIGDDVQDDIHGAICCGIRGYLVKTGKYRPLDENKISSIPEAVCKDFPEAVEILLQEINNQ